MKTSIFERLRDAVSVVNGTINVNDCLPIIGEWDVKIVRADGTVEMRRCKNIVTRAGLNRIAARAVTAAGNTPFFVIGIGTATAAHTLDSGQANLGEVIRRSFITTGAGAQSREWVFGVATFAGAADAITSLALGTAGISDHPNSHASTGILGNMVNGLGVVLADSDFLNLTVRIRIGSHDVSHST